MRKNMFRTHRLLCGLRNQASIVLSAVVLFSLHTACQHCSDNSLLLLTFEGEMLSQEEAGSSTINLWVVALAAFIALYIFKPKRRENPRKRLNPILQIEREKIILAIEIENLLVQLSGSQKKGFLPIGTKKIFQNKFLRAVINGLGFGHFYKPLHSVKKIRQFLSTLNSIQKIELFLYTKISPEVVNCLLRQLKIQEFFPDEKKRFCVPENADLLKHPIEVDTDTRRVIILTPNKEDHSPEDEKYFLRLDAENNSAIAMRQAVWAIRKLAKNSKCNDNLHDELAELKVQIEFSKEL